MASWTSQILNGLSFAMLLYLLSAGLTLTLGVMRLVNLTHGSFYLIGAYVALEVVEIFENFFLGVAAATLVVVVLSVIVYPLMRAVGDDHLDQALLTFGLLFIFADIALLRWGGNPQIISKPELFSGASDLGLFKYPTFRLFILGAGVGVAALLEYMQRRTMFGALIRGVVDDVEMMGGVGRNARMIGAASFIAGAALAGFGGGLGSGLIGAFPGADIQVLLLALIVVIVGGMGSLTGAFVGSVLVGVLDTVGRALIPELGAALIFLLMLTTLVIRPTGLFGAET